jgi:hypothetical protein
MTEVAHISFEGGGLIVPAHTPYDRQLLFEHLEVSTRQHGAVRLAFNHRLWTISATTGQHGVCTACRRSLDGRTYRFDGQTLCGPCARRTLH